MAREGEIEVGKAKEASIKEKPIAGLAFSTFKSVIKGEYNH